MRIPEGTRYCSLCDLCIAEFAWEPHNHLHENRGEIVDGKMTPEAASRALRMTVFQRQEYRKEVNAIQ